MIDFGSSSLIVSLKALAHNFTIMQKHIAPARLAAVIKQKALGLGYESVAPTLYAAGCRVFYVADALEGKALYNSLPQNAQVTIFSLLSGEISQKSLQFWRRYNIQPVLATKTHLENYLNIARGPCSVRVNVGHNMVGLEIEDLIDMAPALKDVANLSVLGHLPNASNAEDTGNCVFLKSFLRIKEVLPHAVYSLSATAGALLGPEFFLDEMRCGAGIFGSLTAGNTKNAINFERKMLFPFCLQASVVGKRNLKKGQYVGYGYAPVSHDTQAVLLGCGSANGLPVQKLTNRDASTFYIKETACPIIPQSVGMYLSALDVPDHKKFILDERINLIESLDDVRRIHQAEGTTFSSVILRMSRANLIFA